MAMPLLVVVAAASAVHTVDDPGEGVEGRDEALEQRNGRKRGAWREADAVVREQPEGHGGEQLGGYCPQVHAQGVEVLAYCQAAQLRGTSSLNLVAQSSVPERRAGAGREECKLMEKAAILGVGYPSATRLNSK